MIKRSYFGEKVKYEYDNENGIYRLFDSIRLKVSGIPKKNLCTKNQLYIIKNVGYDIIDKRTNIYIENYKYTRFSGTYREYEELFYKTEENNILNNYECVIPLFPIRFLRNRKYEIGECKIIIYIEFCDISDILIQYENEKVDIRNARLEYEIITDTATERYNEYKKIEIKK